MTLGVMICNCKLREIAKVAFGLVPLPVITIYFKRNSLDVYKVAN